MKAKKFELDPAEVTLAWDGSRTGRRRKLSRESASVDSSSWRLTLRHMPTGVEVQGEVPMGNYSNTQMQQQKEELLHHLQNQLKVAVAKHLRIPGQ